MLARLLIFSLLNFFGGYIFADHIQPSIEYEADLIRLVWTVAEDDPVQSFVIERSEENGYFTPIKELSALFYNNPNLDFRFEDKDLTSGHEYRYRLRYRYADGHNRYSQIIKAYFEKPDFSFLSLYPWPGRPDHLGIDLNIYTPTSLSLSVLSTQGEEIFSRFIELEYGSHSLELSIPDLPEGYYYLRLDGETSSLIKAFVIQ
ncbi:MAG: hypothetical protein AAFQ87_12510 [Bacteroidota bacterium]